MYQNENKRRTDTDTANAIHIICLAMYVYAIRVFVVHRITWIGGQATLYAYSFMRSSISLSAAQFNHNKSHKNRRACFYLKF